MRYEIKIPIGKVMNVKMSRLDNGSKANDAVQIKDIGNKNGGQGPNASQSGWSNTINTGSKMKIIKDNKTFFQLGFKNSFQFISSHLNMGRGIRYPNQKYFPLQQLQISFPSQNASPSVKVFQLLSLMRVFLPFP